MLMRREAAHITLKSRNLGNIPEKMKKGQVTLSERLFTAKRIKGDPGLSWIQRSRDLNVLAPPMTFVAWSPFLAV
jgi:hypothetical protein